MPSVTGHLVSADTVAAAAAESAFAAKLKLSPADLLRLWTNLGSFVSSNLCLHKGVALPGLGIFYVAATAPRTGFATSNQTAPAFHLHESRFAEIYNDTKRIPGKGHVAQLNYHAIGRGLPLHRAAVQRLTKDALGVLGAYILGSSWLKVELPGVGTFARSKGRRLRFDFDLALMAHFDARRPAPPPSPMLLRSQNGGLFSAVPTPAASGPGAAFAPTYLCAPASQAQRGVAKLHALCTAADTTHVGFIKRIQIERWLHQESRELITQLSASTVLDSLQSSAHGKTGQYVMYQAFLQSLYDSLMQPQQPAAPSVFTPQVAPSQYHKGPDTCTSRPATAPAGVDAFSSAEAHPQATSQRAWPQGYAAGRLPMADAEPYPYYVQHTQEHWPHDRHECDVFNKFHFDRLRACRGARGITPKVNEEPLTAYEAAYAQQVHRNRSQSPMGRMQPLTPSSTDVCTDMRFVEPSRAAAQHQASGCATVSMRTAAQPDSTNGSAHAQSRPASRVAFASEPISWHDSPPAHQTPCVVDTTPAPSSALADRLAPANAQQQVLTQQQEQPRVYTQAAPRAAQENREMQHNKDAGVGSLTLNPRPSAPASPLRAPLQCAGQRCNTPAPSDHPFTRTGQPSAFPAAAAAGVPEPAAWSQQPVLRAQKHTLQQDSAGAITLPDFPMSARLHAQAGEGSPVQHALIWGAPPDGKAVAATRAHLRSAQAAQLRASYETQIQQREAVHAAWASTEDTWPYQLPHHPESKMPYYKGPRYVAPHYVGTPLKL